jgi:hypothetical protein
METAKVDVRKLQLLNDRVNQTIEALNHLRLSVHGLSHTGVSPYGQFGQFGQLPISQYTQQNPYGVLPGVVPGLSSLGGLPGVTPQGIPSQIPMLMHSPYVGVGGVNPSFAGINSPLVNPLATQVPNLVSSVIGQPWVQGQQWNQGFGQGYGQTFGGYGQGIGGLSHTSVDVHNDPFVTQRAAVTFPYLFAPVLPVI